MRKQKREPGQNPQSQDQTRNPTQTYLIHCEIVFRVVWPPKDQRKMRRDKTKSVPSDVWETLEMAKRKRTFKILTSK